MLFFYVIFLKEKRPDRCECEHGMQTKVYACGCRKRAGIHIARRIGDSVVTLIADISSTNCMYCVTLLNREKKVTKSSTSVRRQRTGRHCLYRHCCGIVSAEKLMKRRRSKQSCARLRITHDTVSDRWKICNQNSYDDNINTADVTNNDKKIGEEIVIKPEEVNMLEKHEEDIVNECTCDVVDANVKSAEVEVNSEEEICSELCANEADPKHKISIDYSCISLDYNVSRSSPLCSNTKCEESKCYDKKFNEVSRSSLESQIVKDVDNEQYSSKRIRRKASETQRKNSLCKITEILSDEELIENINSDVCKCPSRGIMKQSQSDTSFSETIITHNCIDSILYRELRKKCVSAVKKKLSIDCINAIRNIATKSHQESDINNDILKDFSDDARVCTAKQKEKYNSKCFVNKHRSNSRLQKRCIRREVETGSALPVTWQKSAMNYKKKFECKNCSRDTKIRNRNGPQWNAANKEFPLKFHPCAAQAQNKMLPGNFQWQKNNYTLDNVKLKKKIDALLDRKLILARETCGAKYRQQFPQCKEKPTMVLFRNKRSNGPRDLENFENSTLSGCSSSTTSTQYTKSSVRDSRVVCRCPPYKTSRFAMTFKDRHKQGKYRIDRSSLFSSSSSLSSSKRCHSWTALSRDSVYHKQEPISSSSRASTSLSTDKEGYDFGRCNIDQTMKTGIIRDLRKNQRLWARPRFREQERKKTIYMDEHHVTWDMKHAY
ncbi:uncharacterized protein LOC122398905 [Colletes gigas]|uniref:uncharacterized protein LOC122398905 n=1 Tax=Colletes gigas TaxID=935657 RepID=UPI001C9BA39D|nr:uncharacterized protein LOC122398905 [Colletes gigas]